MDLDDVVAERSEQLRGEPGPARGREEAHDLMVRRRRHVVVDDLRERRHLARQRRLRQRLLHLQVRVRAFFFADAVDVDVPRAQTRGGDLLDLVRDRRAEHQPGAGIVF